MCVYVCKRQTGRQAETEELGLGAEWAFHKEMHEERRTLLLLFAATKTGEVSSYKSDYGKSHMKC